MKGDARPLPTIAFPPTQNSALKTLSTYTPARISPVFHEELARQLPDEAFHLQVEQRHGYRGGWQTAAADDVIDPNLLVAQRIVSFLLVQGEFQRGQDARLAGGGGLVAGGDKIFEFAENVLRPFAEFGPFLDEIVAAFAAGESMRPGTAKTCRPYSVAKLAVIRAPLARLASTTTVPSVMPATMRLRMGNDCLSGGRLKGNCVMTAPLAAMREKSSAFSGGATRFGPVPSTAMVRPLALRAP